MYTVRLSRSLVSCCVSINGQLCLMYSSAGLQERQWDVLFSATWEGTIWASDRYFAQYDAYNLQFIHFLIFFCSHQIHSTNGHNLFYSKDSVVHWVIDFTASMLRNWGHLSNDPNSPSLVIAVLLTSHCFTDRSLVRLHTEIDIVLYL